MPHNHYRKKSDEEYERQRETAKAVMRSRFRANGPHIPDARKFYCCHCQDQAHVMHHASYHPEDHFCVVPMCGSCHQHVHIGTLIPELGIVPTDVGLVRIAIATV